MDSHEFSNEPTKDTSLVGDFRATYSLQDIFSHFETISVDSPVIVLTGAGYEGNSKLLNAWKDTVDACLKNTKSKNITLIFDGDSANLPHDLTIGNAARALYNYLVAKYYKVTVIAMIGDAAWEKHRYGEENEDFHHYGNNLVILKTIEQWKDVIQVDGTLIKKPAYTGPDTKQGIAKLACLMWLFTTGRQVILFNLFGGPLAIGDTKMALEARANIKIWHDKELYIKSLHTEAISAGYNAEEITCNDNVFTFSAFPSPKKQ